MGDIKKLRRKYTTPVHPWNATRIGLEKDIKRKYGTANKKEIWKMESTLKNFKDQAKTLLTRTDKQANKEREQMHERMARLGLTKKDSTVDDILGLQLKDIMDRRLQTIVMKKCMARSVKHARQLITHEHVLVSGKKVTSPSYLVLAEEETTVSFAPDSAFMNEGHPEAYDEEIMKRRLAKGKKHKKEGEEDIIAFDASSLDDPEEAGKKDHDLSAKDLGEKKEEKSAKTKPAAKDAKKSEKDEKAKEEKAPAKESKDTPAKEAPKESKEEKAPAKKEEAPKETPKEPSETPKEEKAKDDKPAEEKK
ncbi:MAG: 30S ribosomal protein S4 [Candidatus Woesearchaeota archaeon]|nr:30S ribosomal protein S4 [Candidatus Woesearchaeota archaeon]